LALLILAAATSVCLSDAFDLATITDFWKADAFVFAVKYALHFPLPALQLFIRTLFCDCMALVQVVISVVITC
jgi:hypothetical protein